MKIVFKSSLGFSLVGAMMASAIGALSVLGLVKLSSNIVNTLNTSRKEANLMELSEDIKRAFQQGNDPSCDMHVQDCYNSCTSSLVGYGTGSGGSLAIKDPSPMPAGMGAGPVRYEGGNVYKGIRVQEIRYVPHPTLSSRADVTVHFSISDDPLETLTAPIGLHFTVFIDEESTSNTIDRCTIASAEITGSGMLGVVQDCRKVGMGNTLVGCGGTERNSGSHSTAFGYKAGGDSKAGVYSSGAETSFLGYEAGKKNTSGRGNTFIGYQSGLNNTEGSYNTFLGYKAGDNNTKGIYNVVIGKDIDVPGGATQRDRLNIGDLIKGHFLNASKHSPLHPNVSKPKVIFENTTVTIEPPINLSTPPYSNKTPPEPSLSVRGEVKIKRKADPLANQPEFKIKTEGAAGPPDRPIINVVADALNIKRKSPPGNSVQLKVEGTLSPPDPILLIKSDTEVGGGTTGSGPGLFSLGHVLLKGRTGTPTMKIEARGIGTGLNLNIPGNLTVEGPDTSLISENLHIPENLTVNGTGTMNDVLSVTNSSRFTNLQVDKRATFPSSVQINQANITNINGGTHITRAQFGTLNESSHTHPAGSASSFRDGHNHNGVYALVGHTHTPCPTCRPCTCCCAPQPPCCPSSRTLKRNIKPFKDYDKSLKDIADTPLFTWQYKKDKGDHPEKVRMGIISEELPKDLQIRVETDSEATCKTDKKQKDSKAKEKKKDKEKVSTPDWPSIYGTLWAGIKAFAKGLDDFKKENSTKFTELSKELKIYLTDQIAQLKKEMTSQLDNLKNQVAETEKALEKHSEEVSQNTEELSELKKQFQETILPLQKSYKEELKKTHEEMKNTQKQLKKVSSHSFYKPSLEARSN